MILGMRWVGFMMKMSRGVGLLPSIFAQNSGWARLPFSIQPDCYHVSNEASPIRWGFFAML